jgi:hypothetical protein
MNAYLRSWSWVCAGYVERITSNPAKVEDSDI